MKQFYYLGLLGLSMLVACQYSGEQTDNKKTDTLTRIVFDLKSKVQDIEQSGFIQDIKITHLQDSLPIGKIDKIIRQDPYLYLLDREQ